MAIAPQKKQLNSASATSPLHSSGADAAQLLAEVKAKIKAQLAQSDARSVSLAPSPTAALSGSLPIAQAAQGPVQRQPIQRHPVQRQPDLRQPAQRRPDLRRSTSQSVLTKRQHPLSVQPEPPAFETLDVQQMAAEGYFQAIAYWLNEILIPHNVYSKVLADEVSGRVKVLIEYERAPKQKRLIRVVCDRLYKLNSNVIEGVHILARPIGAANISWERTIRLPTATERQQRQAHKSQPQSPQTVPAVVGSTSHQPAQVEPAQIQPAQVQPTRDQPTRGQSVKRLLRQRFTLFRVALVCGSAFAAFVFGGFFDLLLPARLLGPVANRRAEMTAPVVRPWYGAPNEPDIFQPPADNHLPNGNQLAQQATAISFRPASRFPGRTVEAAFETVAVSPHRKVANPSDPTVTLMFGGELALNDFTFKNTTDLDTLFSEIDLYRQADVAMMGLAEPLAHASTSLQEDFYQRTRPQAVEALKSGGIDIVGLSSDGSMAHGSRGLSETLTNLDRQGIYRVGAGRHRQEAHRPEILEVKGQRIAYFGYISDGLKGASQESAGVALSHTEARSHVKADIQAIRDQVDWVVVNYRWAERNKTDGSDMQGTDAVSGVEQNLSAEASDSIGSDSIANPSLMAKAPEDWQKTLAREAVDAGADLVVGSHPHQIQGVEVYRDRPIAYSLGDFAFSRNPQTDSLAARDTAALKVSLRNQRMKVELFPVTLNDAKLQKAHGESGTALLQSIRSASKTLDQPLQFPAVLKPHSSVTKPISATTPAAPQAAPTTADSWVSEPNAAVSPETTLETTPETTLPAPNPMMKESEALFMPAEESPVEEIPVEESLEQQSLEQQSLEQQLDAQWQDETWQKSLQEAKETWETPASNIELKFAPAGADADLDVHLQSESDVVSEALPDEPEMYPWQDPFEADFSESAASGSVDVDDLPTENGSIRPYSEPIIGPLSSMTLPTTPSTTLTPPTSSTPDS
ncbi:MAG: CapA family protein [Cyanobacteria bacterium P01_D01_bin.105]